jgi:hypothetical protein
MPFELNVVKIIDIKFIINPTVIIRKIIEKHRIFVGVLFRPGATKALRRSKFDGRSL